MGMSSTENHVFFYFTSSRRMINSSFSILPWKWERYNKSYISQKFSMLQAACDNFENLLMISRQFKSVDDFYFKWTLVTSISTTTQKKKISCSRSFTRISIFWNLYCLKISNKFCRRRSKIFEGILIFILQCLYVLQYLLHGEISVCKVVPLKNHNFFHQKFFW